MGGFMNIRFTLTAVLDDRSWGFSELLGSRRFDEMTRHEIERMIQSDLYSAVDKGTWNIEPFGEDDETCARSREAGQLNIRYKALLEGKLTSRERIMNAAIEVFAEKGRIGAHMETIAEKAGINKAMVYYSFRSKDALYLEVLKKVFADITVEMDALIDRNESMSLPHSDKLIGYIDIMFSAFKQHTCFRRILSDALINGTPELAQTINETTAAKGGNKALRGLEEIIRSGGTGELRAEVDPGQLGMSIYGMVLIFYLSRPLGNLFEIDIHDESVFLEMRRKSIIDLILNGVLVRGSA